MGVPTAGITSLVKEGAVTIANLGVWSVSEKVGTADTTSFGATGNWATRGATIKEWTGKTDGRLDPTDAGQLALINGLGTVLVMQFNVDAAGVHFWSGSALVTGIDPKADVKTMVDVAFSLDGTGPLTFT